MSSDLPCLIDSQAFPTIIGLPETSKFNNDVADNSTLMDQDHSLLDAPQETESEEQDRMKTLRYCFMINVHANTIATRRSSIRTAKQRLSRRDPLILLSLDSIPADESLLRALFHTPPAVATGLLDFTLLPPQLLQNSPDSQET